MTKTIYCCGCTEDVPARLVGGADVYPHRPDLYGLPFWKCDGCGGFVGCHHKTADRTRPLGVIATEELKKARQRVHRVLDPLWQAGAASRAEVYRLLAAEIGLGTYHTAELRSVAEADRAYDAVKRVASTLGAIG